jgi:cob(I)alamin adenosyltransferase
MLHMICLTLPRLLRCEELTGGKNLRRLEPLTWDLNLKEVRNHVKGSRLEGVVNHVEVGSPPRGTSPKGLACNRQRSCLSHLLRLPADPPGGEDRRGYPSRMPRIYTRTGDDGTTGLLYGGRVSKSHPVPEACGSVDEAVAALGLVRALSDDRTFAEEVLQIQRELFVLGADLAANPGERARLEPGVSLVTPDMAERLEARIDVLVADHPLPEAFVVPGANPVSACLDVARGLARRAERRVVELRDSGADVNGAVLTYLNRLSDLLFVFARIQAGEAEPASRPG